MFGLLRRVVPPRLRPRSRLTLMARAGSNGLVASGPFAGMVYGAEACCSTLIPKLLGIYERELTGAIEAGIAAAPDRVIDIGAAEGYYAVGLARRLPAAQVIAYEAEPAARAALARTAEANGVGGRVEIRGRCEPQDLAGDLAGRPALVVCDCEGYERELLDPVRVPGLDAAAVLVELHDFKSPGLGDELTRRFAGTHRVERIWQTDRTPADFPYSDWYTRLLPRFYLEWAVSECRAVRMSWLWMTPLKA